MSDKENNTPIDCDDPCDDCSDTSVLTDWIKPQPKDVDNQEEK